MNLTIVCWVLCVALIIAILVMSAGLVAFVTTAYESIQRIMIARHARN